METRAERRPKHADRVVGARLRRQDGGDFETGAPAVHRGGERLMAAGRTEGKNATRPPFARFLEDVLELAHLVSAVDVARPVVPFEPELCAIGR